jgi:hypothetical protein
MSKKCTKTQKMSKNTKKYKKSEQKKSPQKMTQKITYKNTKKPRLWTSALKRVFALHGKCAKKHIKNNLKKCAHKK